MIGLVLVTHGPLGNALRDAAEHVVGPQTQLACVSIDATDDPERRHADLAQALGEVDTGDGVLLLTDMFGSTPANLALSFRDGTHVEVLSGVNVPMLVKLAKARPLCGFADCIDRAIAAGRKYLHAACDVPESCLAGARPYREHMLRAASPPHSDQGCC
jgi:mannose PTS system EIIA component